MTVFETTLVIAMLIFLCVEVVYLLVRVSNIEADMAELLDNANALYALLSVERLGTYTGGSRADEDLEELKQLVAKSRKYIDKVKGEAKNAGQRKSR